MFGKNLGMTAAAVHWIEAAPVPTRIGPDVAVEAFRQAMNRLRKLRRIHFVAVETGIRLLGLRLLVSRAAGRRGGG